MMNLEEIEQHRARRERDQILYGGYNPQRDKDEEALISEVKRLRKAIVLLKARLKQLQKAVEIEHDQGESFLMQIKELREENERLQAELDGFIHGGL